MSTHDVADRLNWLPNWVNAIEEDHYEVLRNAAFARGYVKAYGRMLGVDEKALLGVFDDLQAARRDAAGAGRPSRRTPPQLQHVGLGITTGVLILLILVALLWWWQGDGARRGDEQPTATRDVPAREG